MNFYTSYIVEYPSDLEYYKLFPGPYPEKLPVLYQISTVKGIFFPRYMYHERLCGCGVTCCV